ncbi:MAG: hypothetical protein QM743_14290 [Chitinophagaceae bacterium]
MKWICTLLALLVLTLSVQPVCAVVSQGDNCCAVYGSGDAVCDAQEDAADHRSSDCNSGCNPFQICACCALSIVAPPHPFTITSSFIGVPSPDWSPLYVRLGDAPAYGFWQPPRIA